LSPAVLSRDRRLQAGLRRKTHPWGLQATTWESLGIFATFFAVYGVLGWYVTVHLDAAPFDATARLAHAYFALHADPGKLAAIGFVWPPLMTLVILPFTAVGAMGTSLLALPLMTASFAAGLLVVLNRTYRLLGLPPIARYALLAALGGNPFFARYATNGMGEMVSLFFLVAAVHFFLAWVRSDEDHLLAPCGLSIAFAGLTRYEIVAYALVMGAFVFVILRTRGANGRRMEGSLLLYALPVMYCVGLWIFFNWLITGNGLHFVDEQVRQRFTIYKKTPFHGLGEPLGLLTGMNFRLFVPTFVVAPLLLVVAIAKRNVLAAILAALVLLNPAMTALSMLRADDLALVQPRFNIRSLPLSMIAAGWLFSIARTHAHRITLVAVIVLTAVAGYPLTWRLMATFRFQDQHQESSFVRALSTGRRQVDAGLDIPNARRVAAYVTGHVHGRRHDVLVDDSQGFAPMLVGGRPDLYFDRIYRSDVVWKRVAARPRGRVRWMLVTTADEDLLRLRYGGAGSPKLPGFVHLRYMAGKYAVFSVDALAPRAT
jgi:hypothetical protein